MKDSQDKKSHLISILTILICVMAYFWYDIKLAALIYSLVWLIRLNSRLHKLNLTQALFQSGIIVVILLIAHFY